MNSINCEKAHQLLMAFIDGEISEEDKKDLQAHLDGCYSCRKDKEQFEKLNRLFKEKPFADIPNHEWCNYHTSIMSRLERKIGWLLLIIGLILITGFSLVKFILEPKISPIIKYGTLAVLIGLVILLIAVVRERLTFYKYDKYSKEVIR